MKKIIKIVIGIIIIIWVGLEIVNYFEYKEARKKWIKSQEVFYIPMPGPSYNLMVINKLYKIFPKINPNYGIDYKPVIYLYPQKVEKVKVELDYHGEIIADYPAYDYSIKGWEVTAYPDGKIINSDGEEYSYLFWEGKQAEKTNYDMSTGFVVKGENTREFLQDTLSKMGLTPKEYNEFIVFWYPKMKNNKYNLIHFADSEYTDTAPLTVIPAPDSMLRVFMVYKPLKEEIKVNPQEVKSFNRTGFSVIEWGGTEIK